MSMRKQAVLAVLVTLFAAQAAPSAQAQSPSPEPTATAAATAVPTAAGACVPDAVRFDSRFGVPPWIDAKHATSRAALHVAAPKGTLQLAVASTTRQRARGLMCVTAIPRLAGMIFVFAHDQALSFWMKDTLVPLDMIFVRANGIVSNVADNVPSTTVDTPDTDIPQRAAPGKYVIELAAGDAARAGIVAGTRLKLPKILAE